MEALETHATPSGNVYIRRTGILEYQSGPDHPHSMVSVTLLSLNLLFCYCMHLFRLRCFTVSLRDMLCWLIALNLYGCIFVGTNMYKYLCAMNISTLSLRTVLAKLHLLSLSLSRILSLYSLLLLE